MCSDRTRLIVLILVVTLVPTDWTTAQPGPSTAVVDETLNEVSSGTLSRPIGDGPWIVRAFEWTQETVEELGTHFEHLGVYPEKGMLLLHLDSRQELEMLLEKGLRVEVDEVQTAVLRRLERDLASGIESISRIPGFECYRLVEETMADAEALVAAYPDLATYIDIGDSWEKTQPGGAPGYDLKVLKLTNSNIPGDKPAAFYVGSTHAREYTTAELVTRFGEWMLANYGVDPDATWVLDHHELHLLLYMNPDGRKKAETGLSWRKNTDNDDGCSNPSSWGTDLNRNWDFQWACCGGSSGNPCGTDFRGPSSASEPEIQAAQAYQAAIFPDQRDPDDLISEAPLDSEGLFIDFHSFGRVMLVPWSFFSGGCSGTPPNGCPPNWQGLLTLARKYSYFPGYDAHLGSTGVIDGASKDYSYGRLGVPGYTVELGTTFFESCANFENNILPENLPGMLQLAKSVRHSYTEPGGPDTVDPAVPQTPFTAGEMVPVTATVDDTRFAPPSPGDPALNPTQNIAHAELYLDTPWWNGGTPISLAAMDGAFDETVEEVGVTLDTTGLAPGRHTLFLRARDAGSAFGATSAEFLYILDPASSPFLQGSITDAAGGTPLLATVQVGPFQSNSDPGTGAYSLQVPPGSYDVSVLAPGYGTVALEDLELAEFQVETKNFLLWPLETILDDDVEAGNQGWTADPDWAITDEASNSPMHSWTDSAGSNYTNNLDIALNSPVFDLSDKEGTVLTFSHIYDFEPTFDFGIVEASTDGSTWTAVATFSERDQDTVWRDEVIPLPMLDGSATAQVRFRVTTDVNTTEDGWHVDDIALAASMDSSTAIFADGFESSDSSAWSSSLP